MNGSSSFNMHSRVQVIYSSLFLLLNFVKTMTVWPQSVTNLYNLDYGAAMQLHELFEATRIQFGEFNQFYFLIFTKCRKSSESTIRPSCNYFECHNVTQYCPVANIIIMHTYRLTYIGLWQSVRARGLRTFFMFWLLPENGSTVRPTKKETHKSS